MPHNIKLISSIAAVLVTLSVLPACNTIEGAGQDIESAGDAIEDTARDAKN